MSALDDFIHETEHHKIMMAHGTLFLAAREELAQLRLALAERDKTIEEARRLMLAMFDEANYEKGWVNAKMIQTEKDVRIWLSAHPTQESEEK